MQVYTTFCLELQGIHKLPSKDQQILVENPCAKPKLLPGLDVGPMEYYLNKKHKKTGFVCFPVLCVLFGLEIPEVHEL